MFVGAVGMTTNSASQLLKKKMSKQTQKSDDARGNDASVAESPPETPSGTSTKTTKLLAMTLFHAVALVRSWVVVYNFRTAI